MKDENEIEKEEKDFFQKHNEKKKGERKNGKLGI